MEPLAPPGAVAQSEHLEADRSGDLQGKDFAGALRAAVTEARARSSCRSPGLG